MANFQIIAELRNSAINTLNQKELSVFQLMLGTAFGGGTPMLHARPGIGKSATVRSIAKKLDMELINLYTPTLDEVSAGVFPVVDKSGENPVVTNALPGWFNKAVKASEEGRGAIIFLDEVNRIPQHIQNSIMNLLNEKAVGDSILPENVLLVGAGNLGEEDGTEVFEMDSAMESRLIQVPFDITLSEWVENFAKENVHSLIVEFIESDPRYYYLKNKKDKKFANPRSWTQFSNALKANFFNFTEDGQITEANLLEVKSYALENLVYYVGKDAGNAFVRFLNNRQMLSKEDVIEGRFTEDQVNNIQRASILDTANQLSRTEVIESLSDLQFGYVVKFFDIVAKENADQKAAFSIAAYESMSYEVIEQMITEADALDKDSNFNGFSNKNRYFFIKNNAEDINKAFNTK